MTSIVLMISCNESSCVTDTSEVVWPSMALVPADDGQKRGITAQDDQSLGHVFLEALACLPLEMVASKPDRKLPKGLGEKSASLEGSAEEREKLHGYLEEQLGAQSALRVCSRKALSTASWKPHLRLAHAITAKGSHWSTHGHIHSGKQMLEAHEALFLMELGCLELEVGGLPMTLQQAYHTLTGEGLPLQHYMVLASLKRAGYVVTRVHVSTLPSKLSTSTQTTPTSNDPPLHLLPSCPLCRPLALPPPAQGISLLEVHRPKGVYKKSCPGPPDFRVCVFSPQDPFPSPSLLKMLGALTPSAPLRCCVVDGSTMTYCTLTQGLVPPP